MTKVHSGAVMGLALMLSLVLTACQDPNPDKASLAYSVDLYDGCVQCHGESGEGDQDLAAPAIAGLDRWYIKAQLRKFKKSQRGWHIGRRWPASGCCRWPWRWIPTRRSTSLRPT